MLDKNKKIEDYSFKSVMMKKNDILTHKKIIKNGKYEDLLTTDYLSIKMSKNPDYNLKIIIDIIDDFQIGSLIFSFSFPLNSDFNKEIQIQKKLINEKIIKKICLDYKEECADDFGTFDKECKMNFHYRFDRNNLKFDLLDFVLFETLYQNFGFIKEEDKKLTERIKKLKKFIILDFQKEKSKLKELVVDDKITNSTIDLIELNIKV